MRKVSRSALVPYSAAQMYELVKDVEQYPSFLPWCNDAEVHIRGDNATEYYHDGRVVEAAQKAGIMRIGFITKPPPQGYRYRSHDGRGG